MTARRPRNPDAVIRRLRASLDARAGDATVTPAFAGRVQRLRRRLSAWRVAQAVAVTAAVAMGAVVALDTIDRPDRLEFAAPPSASPSATAPAPSPSPPALPSAGPASEPATARATEPPGGPADDGDGAQAEPEPPTQDERPSAPADAPRTEAPRATRVFLDGSARPGAICRNADGTLLATLDLPEAETGYTIDPTDPATMTITSEGVTDVSDRVTVVTAGGTTTWTGAFETDNDSFGLSEVRVVGPSDPGACG